MISRQPNYLVKCYRICYHVERKRKTKCLFKNSKLLAVILAITVLLSQASLVSAYAQEVNNELRAFTREQSNQIENVVENEWKPYNTSDKLVEVFEINPSGKQIIDNYKFENADSPQELMAARGFFSTLADLFYTIGIWFDYDGSGKGTWSGETFYLTGHGMYGGVSVFVYDSNGNYVNTYYVSCIG